MLVAAALITFLGLGNQEAKGQEIVKTEQTDKKPIADSTLIKPQKEIKKYIGVVYDENNTPLPGANIWVKNSKSSTQTNFSGEFSIKAKKGDILVFSYIGFKNVELKLKNDTTLKVYLKNDTQLMGEVIIIKNDED